MASTPAFAKVPAVVTDIPPVHALVAEVMGELGDPVLLLGRGADEHDFQLRPSQAAAVAGADLVVWIGPDLTPWLDKALQARPKAAESLALLAAAGTVTRPSIGGGHDHVREDGTDPHAWLDPRNGSVWLGLIAAELARLDPDNASAYTANAAAATERLQALDTELSARLAPAQGKPLVTFHDAYGYFADRYGLTIAGTIAQGDAAAPGAKRLRDLRATLKAGDILCIFPEVQHDPGLVAQMAEGTGVRIGKAIDPVGSTLEPGPGAYTALLAEIAASVAECVSG